MYKTYAQKKEAFSLRQSEKQWAKVVKYGLSTSIITVKYNEKQNFIALDIVNQHAQNMLKVVSNDSFKVFSRDIRVFPVIKETEKDDIPCSLENKIIQYVKAQIQLHKKERFTSMKSKSKEINVIKKTNGESGIDDMFYQKQNTLLLYSTYQRTESEDPKKYKIKLSTYLHQNCYHCCIELDEEKDIQKIRLLQIAKNNVEQRFYVTCLKMGERLSKIESNITNKQQIISNIRLAQVQLQNIHDHVRQIKKQYSREDPKSILDLSLGEAVSRIQESFYQANEQKYFKFYFENCDKFTILKTLNSRFSQVLHNFIENSIRAIQYGNNEQKIQSKQYLDANRKLSNILTNYRFSKQRSTIQIKSNHSPTSPHDLDEVAVNSMAISTRKINKKLTHHYYQPDANKSRRSTTNINNMIKSQICQTFLKNPGRDSVLDSQIMKFSINQFKDSTLLGSESQQNTSQMMKKQRIKIKFTLLEGQNDLSNIIKVTISDTGGGISQHRLLLILKEIGYLEKDDNYSQFKYLGWKVNQSLIGRLGPYHDFFAQSCNPKGFEVHFFIYQNLRITLEDTQFVHFENQQFNEGLQQSKSNYYSTNSKQLLSNPQQINLDVSDDFNDEIDTEEDEIQKSEKLDEKLQEFKCEQNSEILKSSGLVYPDQAVINKIYSETSYKVSIPNNKTNKNSPLQNTNNGDETTRPIYPTNDLEYSAIFN